MIQRSLPRKRFTRLHMKLVFSADFGTKGDRINKQATWAKNIVVDIFFIKKNRYYSQNITHKATKNELNRLDHLKTIRELLKASSFIRV